MQFRCDLPIPRDDRTTGIPLDWIRDTQISYAALGFLGDLLDRTMPGLDLDESELRPGPDDPPTAELAAELQAAGYLEEIEPGYYRLVWPKRLGGGELFA